MLPKNHNFNRITFIFFSFLFFFFVLRVLSNINIWDYSFTALINLFWKIHLLSISSISSRNLKDFLWDLDTTDGAHRICTNIERKVTRPASIYWLQFGGTLGFETKWYIIFCWKSLIGKETWMFKYYLFFYV